MALPFRQRIFVVLVALTAVPTALAVVGWAVGGRTRGARRDGGVGASDGRPHGYHAPRSARAGGRAGALGATVQLCHAGAAGGDVSPLLRRRVRPGDRVRRPRPDHCGPAGQAPVAPAVAADRRAGGVDPADPAARPAARGSGEPWGA